MITATCHSCSPCALETVLDGSQLYLVQNNHPREKEILFNVNHLYLMQFVSHCAGDHVLFTVREKDMITSHTVGFKLQLHALSHSEIFDSFLKTSLSLSFLTDKWKNPPFLDR